VEPPAFADIGCSIDPGLIGSRLRWVWGEQSSEQALRQFEQSLGVELTDVQRRAAREELDRRRDAKTAYPKWIEPDEVKEVLLAIAS
jgi:hypothetical protein